METEIPVLRTGKFAIHVVGATSAKDPDEVMFMRKQQAIHLPPPPPCINWPRHGRPRDARYLEARPAPPTANSLFLIPADLLQGL